MQTNNHRIYLLYPQKSGIIAPEIYGHFAEHIGGVFYGGLWVGKNSQIPNIRGFHKEMVEKLRHIHAPVIRWPGGCFAEVYDWRDGIGENRPVRLNWWSRNDGRLEPNEVGTHEFMDLCEAVGAKAYFAANLTTMTPMHIRNWMDYCLSPRGSTTLALEREKNGHPEPFCIPYWGVGNENWSGGGNMTPAFYANEFRRYATIMAYNFPQAELIACGENGRDFEWTQTFMREVVNSERHMNGYSMHNYCTGADMDALGFDEAQWDRVIDSACGMEEVICRNWNIISGYGMQKHAALVVDEWGCWYREGSGPSEGRNLFEQQSTLRDAMVTALTLNIFNNHCDKVKMANVAQVCNNLHCLFHSDGERCVATPTYYVYDLYQEHQGARLVPTMIAENIEPAQLSVSASEKDGKTLLTIGNLSCIHDTQVTLEAVGRTLPAAAEAYLLAHENISAHNTFEQPETVVPVKRVLDLQRAITIPKAGILAVRF